MRNLMILIGLGLTHCAQYNRFVGEKLFGHASQEVQDISCPSGDGFRDSAAEAQHRGFVSDKLKKKKLREFYVVSKMQHGTVPKTYPEKTVTGEWQDLKLCTEAEENGQLVCEFWNGRIERTKTDGDFSAWYLTIGPAGRLKCENLK